ncbi:unnamed protein product [Schistosoma turkestanicum]|nr:unnamed protein product [Schistosoma turkestanicum]
MLPKVSLTPELWTKIFIVVNSLFVVFNFILFAIGLSALTTLMKYGIIMNVPLPAIYGTVIFTGLVGIIAAVIGLIGLWKKKNYIALAHMIGLGIVTLVNVCIAFAAIATKEKFNTDVQEMLYSSVSNYNQTEYGGQFDKLQVSFYCCGAISYKDYPKFNMKIPPSCRVGELTYARGCIQEVIEYAQQNVNALIALCLVTAILQGVYLGISMWMLRKSDDGLGMAA